MITKKGTLETIVMLFVMLFLYTGVSKLWEHQSFKYVLSVTPILKVAAGFISLALPIFELALVALLIVPKTRKLGLWISFITMVGFTCYLIYMVSTGDELPCSCGGVISQMTWQQHIVFNIAFVGLAIAGITIHDKVSSQTATADQKVFENNLQ